MKTKSANSISETKLHRVREKMKKLLRVITDHNLVGLEAAEILSRKKATLEFSFLKRLRK